MTARDGSDSSQYKIARVARHNGWAPVQELPDYARYERAGRAVSIVYAGGGVRVLRLYVDDVPRTPATRRMVLHLLSLPVVPSTARR